LRQQKEQISPYRAPQAQREQQDAEHVEGDLDLQRPIQADDVLDEDEPLQHRRVDGDDRKAERLCRIIPGKHHPEDQRQPVQRKEPEEALIGEGRDWPLVSAAALVQRGHDEIAAQREQHQYADLANIQYSLADKKQLGAHLGELAVTLHFCNQMGIGDAQCRYAAQGIETD